MTSIIKKIPEFVEEKTNPKYQKFTRGDLVAVIWGAGWKEWHACTNDEIDIEQLLFDSRIVAFVVQTQHNVSKTNDQKISEFEIFLKTLFNNCKNIPPARYFNHIHIEWVQKGIEQYIE